MIQRKQTLFLVLAILLTGLMFAFPLVSYTRAAGEGFDLKLWGLVHADGSEVLDVSLKFPMHVVAGLLMAVLVVVIALYKNRPRQLRIVRAGYIFALTLLAAEVVTHTSIRAYLAQGNPVDHSFLPAFFFPIGVIVLCFLAERGIKADEELIRSADRLR